MSEIWKFGDLCPSNIPNPNETVVDTVKEKIMNEFRRKNLKAGDVLGFTEREMFFRKLNPLEQEALEEAANSLIEDKVLETNSNNDLVLTKIGVNFIYQ